MVDTLDAAYAVVQPGFEDALEDELGGLGIRARNTHGGVLFQTSRAQLHEIHLRARTPTRVWIRVGRFKATSLEALAKGTVGLAWGRFVRPRQPLDVRVTTHRSRLRHRDRIARKVTHAVQDSVRRTPTRGRRRGPPPVAQRVLVRIEDDQVEVSVDASGEALYRRGWRTDIGAAPLRENLAACVLRQVGWRPGVALVDPMCGSGTFCIEAAAIAAGHQAGSHRHFAFEQWPGHDEVAFAKLRRRKPARAVPTTILGSDRDARVLDAARQNARRARVGGLVRFEHTEVASLEAPPGPGLVIANPPWGDRLGGAEAAWSSLGACLRERFRGWHVAVLVPHARLQRRLRLPLEPIVRFRAGSTPISVYTGSVPA